jgi:DNA-entry nuclease
VIASLGFETMPAEDEERGSISHVYPSGWVQAKYDVVNGKYLYNRSHLIGWQLSAENDNKSNLITGTRYFNVEGMLPFENMVADYVKETDNHVLYRVTPLFEGEELVARGVQMEAWSVEDEGDGVCFNVYIYNVQPGVAIDYATGESKLDEAALNQGEQETFVLNINSKKFHNPECSGAKDMKAENRQDYTGTRDLLVAQGYQPCGVCKP